MVMKGFRILKATNKELTDNLEASEKMARSLQEAYATLEEKGRSDEASYTERISNMENQVRAYEAAYSELVSEAKERICADATTYTSVVAQLEEKLRASELACSELSERMRERESTLKSRESVSVLSQTRRLAELNDVYLGSRFPP